MIRILTGNYPRGIESLKYLAIAAAVLPGVVLAGQVNHPAGPNLTYGAVSTEHNILSNVTNPAFGATALKEEENEYRLGILNLGFSYELGKLDNVIDAADAASLALENTVDSTSFTVTQASGIITIDNSGATTAINTNTIITDQLTSMTTDGYTGAETNFETELNSRIASALTAEIDAAVSTIATSFQNDINATVTPAVNALNDNGSLKLGMIAYVPLTPLVITHNKLGGSLVLNANISVQGKLNYTSSYTKPAAAINANAVTASGDPTVAANWSVDENTLNPQFDIATDAAVAIKTAAITEIGVGYSMPFRKYEKGQVYLGGGVNLYQVGLSKSFVGLAGTTNTDRVLRDQVDASLDMDNGFGIDLGAMWIADNYSLGATVSNINSPSFDYQNTSVCSDFSNYVDLNNASNNVTSTTLAQCNAIETYSMDPQLSLEASTHAWNDKLTLGFGLDANAVADPLGAEYQWLTASAGANLGNWIAIRGGYRSNLADNGLSFYSLGATALGVNLDLAVSKESIDLNGSTVPRAGYLNISWGVTF